MPAQTCRSTPCASIQGAYDITGSFNGRGPDVSEVTISQTGCDGSFRYDGSFSFKVHFSRITKDDPLSPGVKLLGDITYDSEFTSVRAINWVANNSANAGSNTWWFTYTCKQGAVCGSFVGCRDPTPEAFAGVGEISVPTAGPGQTR